jgi:hypothetical protein
LEAKTCAITRTTRDKDELDRHRRDRIGRSLRNRLVGGRGFGSGVGRRRELVDVDGRDLDPALHNGKDKGVELRTYNEKDTSAFLAPFTPTDLITEVKLTPSSINSFIILSFHQNLLSTLLHNGRCNNGSLIDPASFPPLPPSSAASRACLTARELVRSVS